MLPGFIPRTYLFGAQTPPSRRIRVAQIGCGRMGTEDMQSTMKHDLCRMVAVCDLDSKRLESARSKVEQFYKGKGESRVDVKAYRDYHEVLARPDIDAVIVTPPDHWHALVAVEAVLAGKDAHVQKPLTYDIAEAIALRTAVRAKGRILQTGSQQRSAKPWNTFRIATEAVRNGRIGQIKVVRIGIGQDQPKGKAPQSQPVPPNLDYDTWLGPAPQQPYMEDRVHPQDGLGRPGWITTEDFGLGMITNWGAHHMDIAHWGMGMELSGPTSIEATAQFMTGDVWTVHHTYHVEMTYPNGVLVVMDNTYPNGIRFEGTDGWVFCARGSAQVTASDPGAAAQKSQQRKSLDASDAAILQCSLWAGRHALARERRSLSQLARGDSEPEGPDCTGRPGRAQPRGLRCSVDRDEAEAQAEVGSEAGTVHRRRRGQRPVRAQAALRSLRHRASDEERGLRSRQRGPGRFKYCGSAASKTS